MSRRRESRVESREVAAPAQRQLTAAEDGVTFIDANRSYID
jgi:hypothetical protein